MSKKYNPKIHHRRSIRLKGYDYSREGLYFITLCCQHRKHIFGSISNGKMTLSPAGEIVKEEWQKTPRLRPNTKLHQYIIMPNHFHAIIEILFSAQAQSRESQSEKKEFDSKEEKDSQSGESKDGSKKSNLKEDYCTGELQFAPMEFAPKKSNSKEGKNPRTGESKSAPRKSDSKEDNRTGESQFALNEFAPTDFKSPSQTIGAIIRGFKGASTKRIKEYYFSNSGSGEFKFAPKESIKKSNSKEDNRTGELQFDSESNSKGEKNSQSTGELQFAPTRFAPTDKIWQRDYYEHIIRDEKSYHRISKYIQNNPAQWKEDTFNR